MNKYNDKLFHGASPKLFENARGLRKQLTKAESLLWTELRNRKLNRLKFRRQHPIDKYVADFYCAEINLIIELDGSIHGESEIIQYDGTRTKELNKLGISVLRFTNEEIINNMPTVLKTITNFTSNLSPHGDVKNGENTLE
ncbi:MAG: endonuclease domain-containing protein [Flavisolibacter sp.]|nr:endonuclease domain-containing protein [Flavisolibacter sp.]